MDTGLLNFLEFLPVCICTDSLADVFEQFQVNQCDRLLVVNPQRQPLGILPAHHFMVYLAGRDRLSINLSTDGDDPSLDEICARYGLENGRPLLQPIMTLSSWLDWHQVQIRLQNNPDCECVLVDDANCAIGIVNRLRFWHRLATRADRSDPRGLGHGAGSGTILDGSDPQQVSRSGGDRAEWADAVIRAVSQIFEQFPLPLMVQTESGEILSQNVVWQQQIGMGQETSDLHEGLHQVLWQTSHHPIAEERVDVSELEMTQPFLVTASVTDGSSASAAVNPATFNASDLCKLGPDPDTCVCVYPNKDGEERIWKFVKVPLHLQQWEHAFDEAGQRSPQQVKSARPLWLVIAQDATEQQRAAKELTAKNADLIQLNRLKDEFLACISHELKTPLTAVLGLSGLLKDQRVGELNERQTRYAHLIYQSGRHLVLIVNDILDLTRIETGQLKLSMDTVNLQTLCESAYRQAQQFYLSEHMASDDSGHATARFSLEIEAGLTDMVGDEMRLRQMLAHLLSNALKFTQANGKIGLNITAWEGWIAFTVWDTGIGIPTDKQHLIFQKFQQLEHPLTRRFEGTGLGLVLTQKLAQLHGGDLTFTSIEGRGSQFTLILPPTPPSSKPENFAPVQRPGMMKPRQDNRLVVVVEAAPQLLEQIMDHLNALGYRVAIARSGTEAIGKIRRLQPVAVLMNPDLPLLCGWDVLTLLKSDPQTQHIPVVVTAPPLERGQARRNQASGFLPLPIQIDALRTILDSLTPQPFETPLPHDSPTHLTVLHLNISGQPSSSRGWQEGPPESPPLPSPGWRSPHLDLNHLLHPYHCRVLEVEDIDQADLLARVWKPDVMLIDGIIADPFQFMEELRQASCLASLPLITVSAEMTQAANHTKGLAVFPCLELDLSHDPIDQHKVSALIQVIQVAAGVHWMPQVLLADLMMLSKTWALAPHTAEVGASSLDAAAEIPHLGNWPQALAHYIETAGLHCAIAPSWPDVIRQIQTHAVDLLLLYLRPGQSEPIWMDLLKSLSGIDSQVPILVLDGRFPAQHRQDPLRSKAEPILQAIATEIIPMTTALSMKELLDRVHRVLVETRLNS